MFREVRQFIFDRRAVGARRGRDAAKPGAGGGVVLVVFPQQRHEQIHIKQEGHEVWLSNSLTSRDAMTPFSVRITGSPSFPVAIVKRAPGVVVW
jgi:hypothetical protein